LPKQKNKEKIFIMALNFDAPDSETAARLLKAFPNYKEGFVRIHPGNLYFEFDR
jgi:hypothetical protein